MSDFVVQFRLFISLLVRLPPYGMAGLAALRPMSWYRVLSALLDASTACWVLLWGP